MTLTPHEQVPLSARTSFEVGGAARYFAAVAGDDEVRQALAWADEHGVPVEVLGGGSNVLVADRGLEALVVRVTGRHLDTAPSGDDLLVEAEAGLPWDELVSWAVAAGASGIECLAGIPGHVGAAPIQNIGAYGQEVGSVLEEVHVISRADGSARDLDRAACQLGYRDSIFKGAAEGRYLVTRVRLRLRRGGPAPIAYAELGRALGDEPAPSLRAVRDKVVALRRAKSMVIDPGDENRRSAGSFFVNPTLPATEVDAVAERVAQRLGAGATMPRYPAAADTGGERIKLSAAWLIERAGMARGWGRGPVGMSTRHTLAIVNRGGATAAEIVAFAAEVRARVREAFGVTLTPEPKLLGFEREELAGLVDPLD
jgi:UDP-N-acetylmuramate dehydrogenase